MGPNPSGPIAQRELYVRPFTNDEYRSMDSLRTEPVTSSKKFRSTILKTAFTGVWSVIAASSLGPCPRTGHFYYYDADSHTAYVGYGLTEDCEPIFDLWALDTLSRTWREIPLRCRNGHLITGRSGTRASLIGTHLVLFGGYSDPTYFDDLHTIDVVTGEVALVTTSGITPSPRTTPLVAIYNQKFFVWGGYNGECPNELNVLDFSNMTWSQYPQDIAGRTGVSSAIIGNTLYCYGGSKSGGMLTLNMDTFEMEVRETIGAEPPSAVMGSGMVAVDKYVFFFGGKANSNWTLMYACDVERMWWFVFHIQPDGESVSYTDGTITDMGLFMLPRIHSFGVCYVNETREIIAFLGHPEKDPPPLFIVSIGDAMGVVHMREDMVKALSRGKEM